MSFSRSVEKQDAPLAIGINAFFVCLVGKFRADLIQIKEFFFSF